MRSLDELQEALASAAPSPRDRGRIVTIGVRKGGEVHETPERVELSVPGGVMGDRWSLGAEPERHSQVTMMSATVCALIEHEQRRGTESGDNFYVALDLSIENLPPGTRLRLGTAVLRVTEEPHRGCSKFSARFGADALRWMNLPEHRSRRLRGIHLEVLEPGFASVGGEVDVLERAPSPVAEPLDGA